MIDTSVPLIIRKYESALSTYSSRYNEQSFLFFTAEHAPGLMPGVLTIHSREKVTIPRDKLGGIALRVQQYDQSVPSATTQSKGG